MFGSTKFWRPVFETNDIDAFIPEVWAQESLMILEAEMVMAQLIHRDFENEIAEYGDTVNTRQVAAFTAKRKGVTDNVTIQNATATNVPVVLDQHIHTSFLIRDGQESKGFKNLRDEFLVPAVQSIAQQVDEVVWGCVYSFLGSTAGKLGTALTASTVIDAREKMNDNKVPMQGRNFVVGPAGEADLLAVELFTSAEKVGDDGSALREGYLGRKYGFQFYMSQNTPSVASGSTVSTGAVNNASGYAAGSTTITIDGHAGIITAGSWCTIAGDMTPQMITATGGDATLPTSITITPGLRYAVVDDAVITIYTPGAVNLSAGYAAASVDDIAVDGFSVAPKVGQMVTFGTASTANYSVINMSDSPTTTEIALNRGLDSAIANNDVVGLGPAGNYNFAFHRNSIALVSRPLATPAAGTGALSATANYNGVTIRVTITYDGDKQGHLVTVDLLCGVKQLDDDLGVIVFG